MTEIDANQKPFQQLFDRIYKATSREEEKRTLSEYKPLSFYHLLILMAYTGTNYLNENIANTIPQIFHLSACA